MAEIAATRRNGSARASRSFTLLDDQPYVGDADPLGFDAIAGSLANLVLASRGSTPFTLGIEAGWGTGKSTLMRRVKAVLDRDPQITTVWFNAWTSNEGNALEGLIKSVLDRLDPSILRRAARNKRLLSWARALTLVGADWLRIGSIVDALWKEVAVDPKARNEIHALMEDAMERWAASNRGVPEERLLVVFVDDLDRCPPANVLQIFEAVKLYLDVPRLVFVIGYDPDVVSDAVLNMKQYSEAITSHQYVEKIVQIVYRIPGISDAGSHELMHIYLAGSGTRELFDESATSLTIEQNERNPRRVKRFINSFVLEYGLDAEWEQLGPSTLVRVLLVDAYFPEFGRQLRSRSDIDPVDEFREYVFVREQLRRKAGKDPEIWGRIQRFFESHGISTAEDLDHAQMLQMIEQELPETYPKLAMNQNSLSLLEGFGDADERQRIREKMRRYSPYTLESLASGTASGGEEGIFISYRRQDASIVGRLYQALAERFGADRVFVDTGDIAPGVDRRQGIVSSLDSSSVVVAVIGPDWLSGGGTSRGLDDPTDQVWMELMPAFGLEKRVIPLLVDGAQMPSEAELPEALKPLARRNALEISSKASDSDVDRVIRAIGRAIEAASTEETVRRTVGPAEAAAPPSQRARRVKKKPAARA
jgi:KAP family P-loop domain/TIR domain